jgi:hypothetical protein
LAELGFELKAHAVSHHYCRESVAEQVHIKAYQERERDRETMFITLKISIHHFIGNPAQYYAIRQGKMCKN